ncbi:hypothetical protein ACJRO7_030592 [Eucalyptus globulus]|uniref:FAF domain-containing protein n=1 Tax=Eucalyptus globulus TaxID=34317 RepID=A0ABD3JI52_EUCGL
MPSSLISIPADSDATAKMKIAASQPGTCAVDSSFLYALTHAEEKNEGEQGAVYVNPILKCSSSCLSNRSLKMCIESLGNETGSDVGDSKALLPSPGGVSGNHHTAIRMARKRLSRSGSFPPPLTSAGSSMGVQMRSRREGGRLVVEAVAVSSHRSFFHVDRTHGHVRLRFMEESDAPKTIL